MNGFDYYYTDIGDCKITNFHLKKIFLCPDYRCNRYCYMLPKLLYMRYISYNQLNTLLRIVLLGISFYTAS